MRISRDVVRWNESDASGPLERERAFFTIEDWMYELDVRARPGSGVDDRHRDRIDLFMSGVRVTKDEAAYADPSVWYAARFGCASPLKFNAFFSVFSSLAFAVLMLVLATWRLGRIDF